jgi:hypothetical protein
LIFKRRLLQTDINKLESDVSGLQSNGVNINVSNQVTANSNDPVSSGAVYTYVNENLSSAGGNTVATSFDITNSSEAVSASLVNTHLNNNNYVTSSSSSSSATEGQVLTVNDQGTANWATPSSGSALPAGGTDGDVLTINNTGAPVWEAPSGSTAVYLAADASFTSVSDGFITYSSSPIVQNGTFSNNAFSPGRTGDYKVTSNLTFTGGSATVRIGKSLTQLSNNILTAALSYDFRTASNTYTTPDLNLFLNDDSASLILDSGSATINTSDGYQGGTSHYIDLTSFPTGSKLPPNFAFELVLKLNSPSGQPSTSNQPIFVVHKNVRQLEEHMIRLFRYGTTSDLRLQFNNSVDSVGVTLSDHHIAFNNNHQEFEHLFIQFTSNGCTVYRNGVQATATQSTSNPNNNQATLTTSNGTAINVTKVTLGRYLDRNGSGSSDQDNGIEHIKFFRYYTQSATADQVRSLYEQHALQLDVLGKSSGSGTIFTQTIAQQLGTTDSIKVHAEGTFTGYSGDAALIVEHVDGGSQGPVGTGVPDVTTGTSGQVLTLDSSVPPRAVWTGNSKVYCSIRANASTSVGDGSLYTSWDSSNAVTSSSSIVSSTIPFIAPRAGTYYVHFYTTVRCPSSSGWSAVRLVRYVSGGTEVNFAISAHSGIDSSADWRPHAMGAIVTLGNAERLGVRIFSQSAGTSGINQDGTLTELTVHNVD